jgi:hypothetical protein
LDLEGVLTKPPPSQKLPDAPLVLQANAGSFDCAAVRFADGRFAQDDRS